MLIAVNRVTKASRRVGKKGFCDTIVRRFFITRQVVSFYHFDVRNISAPTPSVMGDRHLACIEEQGPEPPSPGFGSCSSLFYEMVQRRKK